LRADIADLFGELPMLFSERMQLLSLELQRAGLALGEIVLLIVVAAILTVTAWLVLWGAAAVALFDAGVQLGWVLVILFVPNFLAACLAAMRIRTLSVRLGLPATMRRLINAPPPSDEVPVDEPVIHSAANADAHGIRPAH
jgi:Putative Actinobacterial Holin-X, holin superfamily III